MAIISVKKNLTVAEDLALGIGTVDQERGAGLGLINGGIIPYDDTKSVNEELDAKESIVDLDAKLATKEPLGGDSTTPFEASDATTPDQVVTKRQLDALSALGYTQAEVDALLALKANLDNVMSLDGSTTSPDYSLAPREAPANKGYVLDTVTSIGAGDMAKAIYDTNDNGRVDTADGLGVATDPLGVTPSNQFMRLSQGTLLDCDLIDDFGIWVGADPLNGPVTGALGLEQLQIGSDKAQRAYSFITFKWYDRVFSSGGSTWSSWNEWATVADVNLGLANKVNLAGDILTGQLKGLTPVDADDLTRKDYVDSKLPLAGGIVTGQIKGIAPVDIDDLTRKDYVDAVIGSVDVGGLTPIGGIVMYAGAIAAIPANWQLCDGTNGTPNLFNRFARGTSSEGDIGLTGGTDTAQNIAHTHPMPHTHTRGSMEITGTVSQGADHGVPFSDGAFASDGGITNNAYDGTVSVTQATFAASRSWVGNTSEPTIADTSASGVDGTNANIPAYTNVLHIQRMS